MDDIKNLSLVELEALYRQKLQHWASRKDELLKQVQAGEQQIAAYDQKLR